MRNRIVNCARHTTSNASSPSPYLGSDKPHQTGMVVLKVVEAAFHAKKANRPMALRVAIQCGTIRVNAPSYLGHSRFFLIKVDGAAEC